MDMEWEGAELSYYCNGESYAIPLSDMQFITVAKILGLNINGESISCFSDESLKSLYEMKSNPLKLIRVGE